MLQIMNTYKHKVVLKNPLQLVWILGGLLTSIHLHAQNPKAETLNLEQAITIALKNSLEIQLAKNDLEANTILNNYGVAGGLPLVTATASNTEQVIDVKQKLQNGTEINRRSAAGNNTSAGVAGSLVLYNGLRVVSTKKRLEELQLQSGEFLNSQIQNTIAMVSTSYYDILRQQSYVRTLEQSILASAKRLEILEARQNAGLANDADLFQAKIDLNSLNQGLQSQLLIVEQAKTELLRLLTLNTDTPVSIQDTIRIGGELDLGTILGKLGTNADIKAAESQIRINELIVREVMALRYPTVRLNMAYNYTRNQSAAGFNLLNQNLGPNAGISVAIPIYNGSAFKRQQQVAKININNAELQRDILTRDYQAQTVKMFQSYKNTLQQLTTEKQNYELSKQLLELTLKRFELIQATIIDVREAQRSFEEAGYRLVNLAFAAKSAEIELNRLTNSLAK
jgi:outer membrane protein